MVQKLHGAQATLIPGIRPHARYHAKASQHQRLPLLVLQLLALQSISILFDLFGRAVVGREAHDYRLSKFGARVTSVVCVAFAGALRAALARETPTPAHRQASGRRVGVEGVGSFGSTHPAKVSIVVG